MIYTVILLSFSLSHGLEIKKAVLSPIDGQILKNGTWLESDRK